MAARNAGNVVPFSIGPSGRNGRKSKKTAAKIIGHIRLLSFARSDDGVLFIELEFKSGRKQKCRFFRLDDVSVHSRQFNQLNLAGARLFSSAVRNEFIARIQDFPDDGKRRKVATRLGWHGLNFVLPKRTFGPNHKALLVHLDDAESERFTRFRVGGTMRGWRELAKLAIGNTRLMLFLAAGLSGPVAALLGVEQVGIMLVGDPATGKTTVIIVVGSMWGRHVDQNKALEPGLAQTFNATDNSLEDDHLAANHTVLCLDETRSQGIPDKEIGPAFGGPVMRLSSGFEKGWQNATAPRRSSAVPILVSSNLSLQQFANQARIKIDDALHSRMIAVPLRPGDHGVYEKIHGSKDGAQFSAQLRKIAEEDFGHPSREFPKALTAENARDPEKLRRWLEARREFFLRSAKDISSPMQNLDRTKAKFATVYAAACFAIKHNILPWKSKAVAQSLRACLFDHVMQVAREAPFTEVAGTGGPAGGAKTVPHQPLVQLRDFVRANHDKVLDLATAGTSDRLPKDGSDWPILKSSHKEYGPEYLFTDKALLALLGDKSHVQQLKLSLNEAGHIATDKGSGGDL